LCKFGQVQVCPVKEISDPSSCPIADVYLLDEDLSSKTRLKGQNYWNSLSYIFEDAKFVSITGGQKLNWAVQNNHPHFEHKSGIIYGDNTKNFVEILNELL
jgi:hypothetical protein